jgi:hypothetical protein
MKRQKAKGLRLTGITFRHYIIISLVIVTGACHRSEKGNLPPGAAFGKIIYETSMINRDSTDTWATECLSEFDRKALIDKIFKSVIDGKITPVDYFTGEKISPDKIQKMETDGEFSRTNICKIRFEERWIWNDEKVEMQKQLISIVISYDVFDNIGKVRGQKPIFKLVFR